MVTTRGKKAQYEGKKRKTYVDDVKIEEEDEQEQEQGKQK